MELRQLRYFVAVARAGSVTAAAREHFVTPPAVSLQMKQLEREVGEALFVKEARGMVLTPAGQMILPLADDILRRAQSLLDTAQKLRQGEVGHLRLGSIDAATIYVLPKPFRIFRRRHAGVEIEVMIGDSAQLVRAIDAGQIELAIVTLPISADGITVSPIYKDPMTVVVHPRHPFGRRASISPKALADNRLITYPAGSTTRLLIDQVFIEHGLKLRASMELASPESMKCLAQAGLGASILPTRIVADEVRRGLLKTVAVRGAKFSRTLGLIHKGEGALSAPARAFVDVLKKTLP